MSKKLEALLSVIVSRVIPIKILSLAVCQYIARSDLTGISHQGRSESGIVVQLEARRIR